MTQATYTKEHIAEKLATNNVWLFKGIVAIYKRQTQAEQAAGVTREDNGIGFNALDATILSSFAVQITNWETCRRFPNPLSPKQIALARTKMKKYAGQLAKIANEGIAAVNAAASAVIQDTYVSAEEAEFNAQYGK